LQVVSGIDAVRFVADGDTVIIGGSGGGHAVPEALIAALERRFLDEARPSNITIVHPVGLGDEDKQGVSRLAHERLLKRVITGSRVDSPLGEDLARRNLIEAYTLPQGALSQLMREMAAGRPGLITHSGLNTYADPRLGGGKQSARTQEDLVEIVTVGNREWMFYKPFRVDICFLRGTTADEDGNVTMEQEAVFGEMLSIAQATRRAGGIVIVQVKRIAERHTLPPKHVKIPGILVDFVVVDPNQVQSYLTPYSPAFAGELRTPVALMESLPFGPRKVIVRRAALELFQKAVCNLGSGISTGLAMVAAEENILDRVVLTNEQGLIGGAPATGVEAGAATNYVAMIDQPYQFDFYDGGGLDLAFLSFAEVDRDGNVNVSRFADRIIGFGGFINISQNAKSVVFSGTFTAGGLEIDWPYGMTRIMREGRSHKFVDRVQQVSYSASFGRERGQSVLYVTERAVFRCTADGLELTEIAPGIDLERDVFSNMGFRPKLSANLRTMDARLFKDEPVGLGNDLSKRPPRPRAIRLATIDAHQGV